MLKVNSLRSLVLAGTVLGVMASLALTGCQSDSNKTDKTISGKNADVQESIQTEPADYAKLVGRWLRPDGGYIIEIQKVDINGQIKAAYYNPRSINVSQALAAQKDGAIEVFIELRDTGYPGATYTLKYDQGNDILVGLYYQPAAGQTFDVQFIRKE